MMTFVSDGRSADRPKLGERRSIWWAAQGVFVCSPASITVPLTSITNGWSCGPANRREDAKVLSNAERQRRYIARSGRPPQAATHFGMR
jgi:hypothetical protein